MKNLMLAVIMIFFANISCFSAEDFNLNSYSISAFGGSDKEMPAVIPSPSASALPAKSLRVESGLDLNIKIPFGEINKRLSEMPMQGITVIDPSKPLLSSKGAYILFNNISAEMYGLKLKPEVLMESFFEKENLLAIKFVKVKVAGISMGQGGLIGFGKDRVMEFVINKISAKIMESMDAALADNRVPLKAEDALSFAYDKKTWTLRAAISPKFIAPLLPGLVDDIKLNSFSFDDEGFTLSVNSGVGIERIEGYNLALSEGLINKFIRRYADGSNFNFSPDDYDGGIKFRSDGRIEMTAETVVRELPLSPRVCFTVRLITAITAPNTMAIRFEKVDVRKVYGFGLPGIINALLQGKIISSAVDSIAKDTELAAVMTARKIDDKTLEIKFGNNAFLPSFARGAKVTDLLIEQGLIHLAFEL